MLKTRLPIWSSVAALAVGSLFTAGCQSDIHPLKNAAVVQTPAPVADVPVAGTQPGWFTSIFRGVAAKQTAAARLAAAEQQEAAPQPSAAPEAPPATTQAAAPIAGPGWTPLTSANAGTTTQPAAGTAASLANNPDMTSRFIYRPGYDLLWKRSVQTLTDFGFTIDRTDYRLGTVTTVALPSAQYPLFWYAQYTDFKSGMENTINNQRRVAKILLTQAPGKPDFMIVSVQVLVERLSSSSEMLGGPIFIEGSGFGHNSYVLRSDFAPVEDEAHWSIVGHDVVFEKRILDQLFKHI